MRRWFLWLGILGLLLIGSSPKPTIGQDGLVSISGKIIQGTSSGQPLPQNLPIELQVISVSQKQPSEIRSAITANNGEFTFENVPALSGNDFYILYTTYDGIRQSTPPLYADQVDFVAFPVYETTSQLEGAEIIGGSIQINEFAVMRDTSVALEVVMELQIVHHGDRIIYASDASPPVSFHFELPIGAYSVAEVTPEDSQDLTHLHLQSRPETGTTFVADTLPLIPNWPRPRIIRVTYLLPYPDEAIFDQPFPVPADNLEVWVPSDTVYVESKGLTLVEEDRVLASGRPEYRVYRQNNPLPAGESLIFALQGEPSEALSGARPATAASSQEDDDSGLQELLLIVGGVVALGIGGGIWLIQRRRTAAMAAMLDSSHETDST